MKNKQFDELIDRLRENASVEDSLLLTDIKIMYIRLENLCDMYEKEYKQKIKQIESYIENNMLDYSQARKDLLDIINDK